MALTNQSVQEFYGLPVDANDAAMTAKIDFAKRHVERAGISATHPAYEDLVTLAVGVFMESRGLLKGAIASKTVGDVSTTFKTSAEEPKSWAMQYKELLRSVRGLSGRIA